MSNIVCIKLNKTHNTNYKNILNLFFIDLNHSIEQNNPIAIIGIHIDSIREILLVSASAIERSLKKVYNNN